MAKKIVLAELDIDIEGVVKSTAQLKEQIERLKDTQKTLTASGQSNSQMFVENQAILKSLTQTYNASLTAIAESGKAVQGQTAREELLSIALNKEVTSINEARQQNQLLNKLRNETNVTTEEGKKQIETLNKKIDENNNFLKSNSDELGKQKMNVGNYKSALDGLDSVLANFGINGQQARTIVSGFGGAVTSATSTVVDFSASTVKATASTLGFKTASQLSAESQAVQSTATRGQATANETLTASTVASTVAVNASTMSLKAFTIALASTGIGLIIIAVGALFSYLKDLDSVIDKTEQLIAGLGASFRFLGQAIATLSFDGFISGMAEATRSAIALKEAQQDLADAQSIQEVANAKASQQYDELILKSRNRTLSERERIGYLKEAEVIETANFNQKMDLANKELNIAIESARIKGQLSAKDVENLKNNTIAYATYLLNFDKITQKEVDAIKQAQLGKIAIDSESTKRLEKNQNAQDKLFENAEKEREKQKQAEEKRIQELQKARQEALDNLVKQQKAEIDLFIQKNDVSRKTMQEEIDFNKKLADEKLKLVQLEFNASKKTQADKIDLQVLLNFLLS